MESSPESLLRLIFFLCKGFLSAAEETEVTYAPDLLRIFLNPSSHRAYPRVSELQKSFIHDFIYPANICVLNYMPKLC